MRSPRTDTARVHLTVLGQELVVETEVAIGPVPPQALVAPARAISAALSTVATERARANGQSISCRAGCAACCHQLVPISVLEAGVLVDAIDLLPEDRRVDVTRRFAEAVRRMEELGLLDAAEPRGRTSLESQTAPGHDAWLEACKRYFQANIACPLLEDERCSVYEDRPLACREYLVTTPPERCATWRGGASTIARPAHTSEALGEVARALGHGTALGIPLPLALEWIEVFGAALSGRHDGEALFFSLIEKIQAQDSPPLGASRVA